MLLDSPTPCEFDAGTASSQKHGIEVEKIVLATENLAPLRNQDFFDAPFGAFEPNTGLSIKATRAARVELADATRVWDWPNILEDLQQPGKEAPTVLFVIGCWTQAGRKKVFDKFFEIRLNVADPHVRQKLYGDITSDDVRRLHHGLRVEFRDTPSARAFAYARNETLKKKAGLIRLNSKIHTSSNQRRVQCCIGIADLLSLSGDEDKHCYTNLYRGISLPLVIESSSRNSAKTKAATAGAQTSQAVEQSVPATPAFTDALALCA